MSKKVLSIKRYHSLDSNDYYTSILNEQAEEQKSKNNSNSSGNFRTIIVLKKNEKIMLETEDINEFHQFIECFNCLFYIKSGVKHFLIDISSIEYFFLNSDYHILYDSEYVNQLNENNFHLAHSIPKRKNLESIKEFCIFHQYYFNTPNHKYFYTALWSPNRILKFYRLSDKNYPYMSNKFDKCSNSKIIKFYGPRGTGKSTFIYTFFAVMSTIKFSLKNSDKSTMIKENIKINDLKLNPTSRISIKQCSKPFEQIYDVNEDISKLINLDELNQNKSKNIIDLSEEEEKKNNEKNAFELTETIYYQKEFNSGSRKEDYYFLSSVYIDLIKERTPESSNCYKKYFEFELMYLFKTFKFYQYLLSYLHENKKSNIFDKIKLIIGFMLEVKNNRNYFIILDHISENEQSAVNDLENYSNVDPHCYIIEIPLIITQKEKLNLLNDLKLNNQETKESYDDKDNLTFIKRTSNYGIVYTNNYYSAEIVDKDDIIFEQNFGKNIYFYCLWKYSKDKLDINEYINEITVHICEIFKENYHNNDNELSFNIRTILDIIEEGKEISNLNFLSQLPLDYFVLINKDNKFKLKYSFPLIGNIVKKLNISSSKLLIQSRQFISYFDNFIKGGIMEKVFSESLNEGYMDLLLSNLETINIGKLLDNKIRSYYDYDEEIQILKENKNFIEIKNKNNNNNLKYKNILFKQIQNAKHYDIGLKLYNNGNEYIFFQVTFHKPNDDIMDLLNNLWIDLNYIINKIQYLCDEKQENINGIYIFFVLMDLGTYNIQNKTNEEMKIINDNLNYNLKLIKKLKNYNIDCLFLDNKGDIIKEGTNIIKKGIPLKYNLANMFFEKIKEMEENKKKQVEKCLEDIRKIYTRDKLSLVYYSPNHINEKGFIMANLFENSDMNYYEIEGKKDEKYFNLKGEIIEESQIFRIEKENSKKQKINVLIKIN